MPGGFATGSRRTSGDPAPNDPPDCGGSATVLRGDTRVKAVDRPGGTATRGAGGLGDERLGPEDPGGRRVDGDDTEVVRCSMLMEDALLGPCPRRLPPRGGALLS